MTDSLIVIVPVVVVLLAALAWAMRSPRRPSQGKLDLASLEESGRRHATYFALIRQASSSADLEFLAKRGSRKLATRARKERRTVVLLYLAQLRLDFDRLLRLAKAVAALSPSVGVRRELERLWLTIQFSCRYHAIRARFYSGIIPVAQLSALSQMVSQLAIQMETSIKELGERAAMGARIASPLDRNGMDVA